MKIMNLFFMSLLFFIIFISGPVNGLQTTGGYLHSNDYYSVTYDAEGDAIVAAKLILYNTKNDELKEVTLELPSEKVLIYNLVQEVYERGGNTRGERYYPYYGTIFYPVEYEQEKTSSATLLKLYLSKPIKAQKQGSILLLYKIPRGTMVDFFGVQKFDFKTIIDKNAALIQNIRVSINVQSDLYLKGGKSEVEYKPDYLAFQSMELSKEGTTSNELTDFSRRITYAKGLVKNAYNLDPYESFHVKGEFADSWLKLYLLEILLVILAFVILLLVLKIALWKKIKKLSFKDAGLFEQKNKHYSAVAIRSCIFGFISAFFITVVWFLFMFLFNWLSRGMPYYYGSFLLPLLFLLGLIIMAVSFLGPVVLVGKKYGIIEGILTLIFTGFWLLVFIIIVIVLSGFLFYRSPTPVMEVSKPMYD